MTCHRRFQQEDQDHFARLSGDYNPFHIDPVAARRFIYGCPVVHGVHILLWSLENLCEQIPEPFCIKALDVDLPMALTVKEEADCSSLMSADGNSFRIEVKDGRKRIVTLIQVQTISGEKEGVSLEQGIPPETTPRHVQPAKALGVTGRLKLLMDAKLAGQLFPRVFDHLPNWQLALLLACGRLVGMEYPGRDSIFSHLHLNFLASPKKWPVLDYRVLSYKSAISKALIEISGDGYHGKISAFFRPVPQKQPKFDELKSLVDSREFKDQRVLVIGGSRGIGEVAAKLLSAGGAEVKLSYHKGSREAQWVADEINSGGGIASYFLLDILDPGFDLSEQVGDHWQPTDLLYFATPFIFDGARDRFSNQLFELFCCFYVTGFLDILEKLRSTGIYNCRVLYPSSISLEQDMRDMGEYSAAKAAGEQVCAFVEKCGWGVRFHTPRFPRLRTDQTTSLLPTERHDTASNVLKALRNLKALN